MDGRVDTHGHKVDKEDGDVEHPGVFDDEDIVDTNIILIIFPNIVR